MTGGNRDTARCVDWDMLVRLPAHVRLCLFTTPPPRRRTRSSLAMRARFCVRGVRKCVLPVPYVAVDVSQLCSDALCMLWQTHETGKMHPPSARRAEEARKASKPY